MNRAASRGEGDVEGGVHALRALLFDLLHQVGAAEHRLHLGELPPDVRMTHIVGIGLLGGMGFTMSIFIARLGFEHGSDAMVAAKTGILLASLVAGLAGYLWLRMRGEGR